MPKVLIANRGEIAVRIIRACRELGLGAVAVYSDCDRNALHARLADEAHHLGPSPASQSYLKIGALVDVARRSGASLVHPGYGFLAENAAFAAACRDAGLTFVGPTPETIALMGSKTAARAAVVKAGVPVVPGTAAPLPADASDAAILAEAERLGFPVLVKAVAGGGGKGMRTVAAREALPAGVRAARSEAQSSFGDAAIYLERQIVEPRHIEIQLLADGHGTVLPFVERECSIQRRHQKVVEESPSAALDPATRLKMADAAARIARAAGYTNAGTIECLVDRDNHFYFLEMNTRLQVEHPVTELVTGIDLVQWQLRIAQGARLDVPPDQALTPRGHAIECRIYAEDPDAGFMPSPGLVRALSVPGGPGVRDDRGVAPGFEIPVFYDSMIAKLAVWGATRAEAIGRLSRALDEYRVIGVKTTVPFFQWLVRQPAFADAAFDTTYLDRVLASRSGQPFRPPSAEDEDQAAVAAALAAWFRAHRAAAGDNDVGRRSDDGRPHNDARRRFHWRRAARTEALRGS